VDVWVSKGVRSCLLEEVKSLLASVDGNINEFKAEMLELLLRLICIDVTSILIGTLDLIFFSFLLLF
jgi:hypothetical protein